MASMPIRGEEEWIGSLDLYLVLHRKDDKVQFLHGTHDLTRRR